MEELQISVYLNDKTNAKHTISGLDNPFTYWEKVFENFKSNHTLINTDR